MHKTIIDGQTCLETVGLEERRVQTLQNRYGPGFEYSRLLIEREQSDVLQLYHT